ncbi:MAG: DUF3857 domain-containing protein [Acidobacteria bacterium]|nr:DUF3857 domain-containing protein [Acidobacteriota bacterium]
MSNPILRASFLLLVFAPMPPLSGQVAGSKQVESTAVHSYSHVPAVFEEVKHLWSFQKDGTGRREFHARVLVQHEAAITGLGQLSWAYASANESLDLLYLRVIRPDGSITQLAPDAVQDLPAAVNQGAPAFTDFRERHVTVPALCLGARLEFGYAVSLNKPHVPEHFWGQHRFEKRGACLSEILEIRYPTSASVRFKSKAGLTPKTTTQGSTTLQRWEHRHIEPPSDPAAGEEAMAKLKKRIEEWTEDAKVPDVQFTTFKDWNEVGDWYAALERPRRDGSVMFSTPTIQLLKDKVEKMDQVKSFYAFLARDFRYVSLSFGQGRFQPHPAGEVLTNRYGDCKDKSLLLATFLEGIGVKADLVLCSSFQKVDPEIPSPAQFDHLMLRASLSDEVLWLDPTIPLMPFQALAPSLRGSRALVVRPGGKSAIETIPQEPPFETRQLIDIKGSLTEDGTLSGVASVQLRTDEEVRIRNIFRNAPPETRNRMIGSSLEIPGEILDVKAMEVDDLTIPLELKITFKAKKYWESGKSPSSELEPPLPKLDFHRYCKDEGRDEKEYPGGPLLQVQDLTITLPKGCKVTPPLPVQVQRDYGSYGSSSAFDKGVLRLHRELKFQGGQLKTGQSDNWDAFHRAVKGDLAQKVRMEWDAAQAGPSAGAVASGKDAETLANEAGEAIVKSNYPLALTLLRAAVEKDPKHRHAWNNLGRAHAGLGQYKEAEIAYKRAISLNPFNEFAYNNLGITLVALGRLEEADSAFRKQIEVNPLDEYAHFNLGKLLLRTKKDNAALEALERANQITPNDSQRVLALGEALLRNGQQEKAKGLFEGLAEKSNGPSNWNNIAYTLCEHGGDLDYAQKLAESALQSNSARMKTGRLASNPMAQAFATQRMAATLDTLGWIHHRQGDQEKALRYVEAAYFLSPSPEVALHLGTLFELRKERTKAIAAYAGALLPSALPPDPDQEDPREEIRKRVLSLSGSSSAADAAIQQSTKLDVQRRTILLHIKQGKTVFGQAFIALGPGNRVLEVHLNDDLGEKLPGLVGAIERAPFPPLLSEGLPVDRVVISALVSGTEKSGQVILTLMNAPASIAPGTLSMPAPASNPTKKTVPKK